MCLFTICCVLGIVLGTQHKQTDMVSVLLEFKSPFGAGEQRGRGSESGRWGWTGRQGSDLAGLTGHDSCPGLLLRIVGGH